MRSIVACAQRYKGQRLFNHAVSSRSPKFGRRFTPNGRRFHRDQTFLKGPFAALSRSGSMKRLNRRRAGLLRDLDPSTHELYDKAGSNGQYQHYIVALASFLWI